MNKIIYKLVNLKTKKYNLKFPNYEKNILQFNYYLITLCKL